LFCFIPYRKIIHDRELEIAKESQIEQSRVGSNYVLRAILVDYAMLVSKMEGVDPAEITK